MFKVPQTFIGHEMVRTIGVLVTIALIGLSTTCQQSAEADAIDTGLKSYRLGMTLRELKALPKPVAANRSDGMNDPALLCSDDKVVKKSPSDFFDLSLAPEMTKAGIVRCAFYMKFSPFAGQVDYQVMSMRIADGPDALVSFYLLPGTADRPDMQIFSIVALISPPDYSLIRAALIEKYGKPTASDSSPFVNQLGGQLDNEKLTWDFPQARIIAIMRDRYAKTGSISYVYTDLQAKVDEKLHGIAQKGASDL